MSLDLNFNSEDMQEKEFNYFEIGVHNVKIADQKWDVDEKNQAFLDLVIVDPDNGEKTDSARLWFHTEGARNYSLNILRGIFVHNAPADKKDSTRANFNALKSAAELEAAIKKMLIGKECWFTVYPSATRTYTNNKGVQKPSLDKNVYGYEPAEKKVEAGTTAAPESVSGTPLSEDESKEAPFGF